MEYRLSQNCNFFSENHDFYVLCPFSLFPPWFLIICCFTAWCQQTWLDGSTHLSQPSVSTHFEVPYSALKGIKTVISVGYGAAPHCSSAALKKLAPGNCHLDLWWIKDRISREYKKKNHCSRSSRCRDTQTVSVRLCLLPTVLPLADYTRKDSIGFVRLSS